MEGIIEAALGVAQAAWLVWMYIVVPIVVLVGTYIYIKRSPSSNFGMARDLEAEGKLEEALKMYERMYGNASSDGERRVAETKMREVRRRIARAAADGGGESLPR